MRKLMIVAAMDALALGAVNANAQTTRGAASLTATTQNFTPIEKAACGPVWGRYCAPFHHRVCRRGRCWCAPC